MATHFAFTKCPIMESVKANHQSEPWAPFFFAAELFGRAGRGEQKLRFRLAGLVAKTVHKEESVTMIDALNCSAGRKQTPRAMQPQEGGNKALRHGTRTSNRADRS